MIALVLAACGKADPPPAAADRPAAAPRPEALACPNGTTAKHRPWRQQTSEHAVYTEGQEHWCERADGTRHGPWRITYMNHSRAAVGNYEDGARTGTWTMWYAEGDPPAKAAEETWIAGVRQGPWRSFRRDTGTVWAEATFQNGKLDGDWIEYADDGKRQVVGRFVAGEPEGPFTRTLPDGTTKTFEPDRTKYDPKPIGE